MKNAKKMIMVPEAEYMALLSMINSADPLVREKAKVEGEMSSVLKNPKISADLKMKKHDSLYKQRRHLQSKIENKPQKVVIENLESLHAPSVQPYLDVGKIAAPVYTSASKARSMSTPVAGSSVSSPAVPAKKSTRKPSAAMPYINPNYIDNLIQYIGNNPEKFKIAPDEKVKTSAKRYEGNYKDVVKYMAARYPAAQKPAGFGALYDRLKNDPYYGSLVNKSRQEGFGKKLLSLTPKVKGLKRIKKKQFVPTIWSKL